METIAVAGFPATATLDGNGAYGSALFEEFTLNGSPLILDINPPVANVSEINLGTLATELGAAIANGAAYTGG